MAEVDREKRTLLCVQLVGLDRHIEVCPRLCRNFRTLISCETVQYLQLRLRLWSSRYHDRGRASTAALLIDHLFGTTTMSPISCFAMILHANFCYHPPRWDSVCLIGGVVAAEGHSISSWFCLLNTASFLCIRKRKFAYDETLSTADLESRYPFMSVRCITA